MEDTEKENMIIDQIKLVYAPEIPVNAYDLGLINNFKMDENDGLTVLITLTSPSYAMLGTIVDEVRGRIMELDFVSTTEIELTWTHLGIKD